MLLTENAQKEALEYQNLHYQVKALALENAILQDKPIYQPGGRAAHLGDAYRSGGIEGLTEHLKTIGLSKGEKLGTQGFTPNGNKYWAYADDNVLMMQQEIVEHVKSNNLAGQILHGPSLEDIRNAMHSEEVQVATESVSMARRTLKNIIEGSELAAKVMRYRVG